MIVNTPNHAVSAAQKSFPLWRSMKPEERAACLNRLADLIEIKVEEFARAESIDNGTPINFARAIVGRAPVNLRLFANAAQKFFEPATIEKEKTTSRVLRQPYGIVSTISPWNLPLLLFTWKLAHAIAAGN